MIIVDCVQGTPEWLRARLAVVTASKAGEIITPKTGKPSSSMVKYAYELLAEELLGRPLDDASSGFMERGKELEGAARSWYEFDQDVEVRQVGFVTRDDGKAGCSPDGLVGDDGCIEIKCPAAHTHMSYLLGDVKDNPYYSQMMFTLWITERSWIDFVSYSPDLPQVLVRFQRDEKFIAALSSAVDDLLALLDKHRGTLRELGALPEVLADAA
jgi:YqaJ-like viral recombinase domain